MIARRTFGRGLLGLLAGAASLALAGCWMSTASFHLRMRVEGVYPGAAVYEIKAGKYYGIKLPDADAGSADLKGEALVMETPDGPIFVLLKSAQGGGDLIGALTHALTPDIPQGGLDNFWRAANRLADADDRAVKGELPREEWPLMVRFGDLSDPASVEKVDPDAIGLKRITVEITDDPVTTGIEKRLGWLGTHRGSLDYSGRLHPENPEKDITAMAFKQGQEK